MTMWPIPILIIGKKRPSHFTFLTLYVSAVIIICNFILPALVSQTRRISEQSQGIFDIESKVKSRFRRGSAKVDLSEAHQNVSTRRSHSTKIRTRRKENLLHNHWFSDMNSLFDESMDVFYPWIQELCECQNLSVHFAKEFTFQPTALVSYPGSGNSWLRYLIECTTGVFTGSIFKDQELFNSGLRGEMNDPTDGRTIVQKTYHDTHGSSSRKMVQGLIKVSELVFGYHGILLVRNPYDALWNNFKTKNHKTRVTNSLLEWKQFVVQESKKWAALIKAWVVNSPDIVLIQHEQLHSNSKNELLRILNYLGVPPDNRRLDCVIKYFCGPFNQTNFHSSKNEASDLHITKPHTLFSQDLIDIIQHHVSQTNDILKKYSIPALNYTFSNSEFRYSYNL